MLAFVGLGIRGEESLTLEGLKELQRADEVYAELYTSPLPQLNLSNLEKMIGKKVRVLNRREVEEGVELLKASKERRVALLVPGDPMIATTHIALRLKAEALGVRTKVVHSSSIISAAAGLTGLQNYKFGRSATLPLGQTSAHPYEVLGENLERGLHTLLFLDVKADEGRYMTANEGIDYLLQLEKQLKKGYFPSNRLALVVARAGGDDCLVKGGRAGELAGMSFGPPPHVLVVPGRLHFMEAEALQTLTGVHPDALAEQEFLQVRGLRETLLKEIEKWTERLEREVGPLKSKPKMENILAYLRDSEHFREKGDLVKSFECLIWAWALFQLVGVKSAEDKR
jgi:diphthine synthase